MAADDGYSPNRGRQGQQAIVLEQYDPCLRLCFGYCRVGRCSKCFSVGLTVRPYLNKSIRAQTLAHRGELLS